MAGNYPVDTKPPHKLDTPTEMLFLNELIYKRFVTLGYSGIINFNTIGTDKSVELFCQVHIRMTSAGVMSTSAPSEKMK